MKMLIQNYLKRGVITLPVVLIMSVIIMEIAIAAILISGVFGGANLNTKIGAEAYAVALAGAEDGVLRVIRYCPIGTVVGSQCPGSYSISVGTRTANVIIKDDPQNPGHKIVISRASIFGRVKRVEVVLLNNQDTGKTEVKSRRECYNYDSVQQMCL